MSSTPSAEPKHRITLSPSSEPPTRDNASAPPTSLPAAKASKSHPTAPSDKTNASLFFVGTATTVLEWQGIRILTDPNFLHMVSSKSGPSTRVTNPAVDLEDLPNIDLILLSHYHADHFDAKVEASLRRDLPIVTTPHAKDCLVGKKEEGEQFTQVYDLDHWETGLITLPSAGADKPTPTIRVTGMPGKHVPPGLLSQANDLLGAVPPTNGWMLELGASPSTSDFKSGYRIYISGDTLLIDDLKEIPARYKDQKIDLMLIHLGGTTIPGPKLPLLMVTMDAEQGVGLMKLIGADVTIPIHFDDYDVFLSPLEDFKKAVERESLGEKVVYLDRGEEYRFDVK
ncbi:hypothetical protein B0A48_07159 [Cryoendolithus antarcticus]|uniref:Metallo-beta-lactamase domain-containing protein n=1 Tax=Cryoendolithus antarcticus TaxID=1507870 RepID=A0A1V8T8G2_9PEZI|nr:hypothetical protein B0A48_07159 [Cryoendolithus antarcticus]